MEVDTDQSDSPDLPPPSPKGRNGSSSPKSRSSRHTNYAIQHPQPAEGDVNSGPANHTPSWNKRSNSKEFVEMEEIPPESSRRHSHQVHHHVDEENKEDDDDDIGHLGDGIAEEAVNFDLGNINNDAEATAVLEDIERKVRFGGLGSDGGGLADYVGFGKATTSNSSTGAVAGSAERGRAGSVMKTTIDMLKGKGAARKGSVDSFDYVQFGNGDGSAPTGLRLFFHYCRTVIEYLTPDLHYRMNVYLVLLFLLVIAFVARNFDSPNGVFKIYICTVLLELACSMVDRVLYWVIDNLFESRFDVAYQLHSLNGPFGLILTVLIMNNFWHHLHAEKLIRGWDSGVTAAAVFIICLCAKNWLGRRQYVYLLERRFTEKVESLNSMIIMLSELASTRPPKASQLHRATTIAKNSDSESVSSVSGIMSRGKTEKEKLKELTIKVRNVFEDMVEPVDEESSEEAITRKELYKKRRSFWQSAARLSHTAGVMKVITYDGVVTVRNQEQAKQFGQKLYKHLSRGGKIVVTPELIHKLFDERKEAVQGDEQERAQHEMAMASITSPQASAAAFEEHAEEKKELWSVAVQLFDPFGLGRISEDCCTEAVLNIYKEQRFTAASINDFGELHQSLRLGMDIVYWIIMLFVLQSLFGFDLTSYLLPFITLLLTVSFAIAPLVGNVFLSFAFVFFMAPYDIGNKVQFGLFNIYTPPVIGCIKSVSLLYTVVTTSKNETVKIPNHTLYGEKIYNLTETSGAQHEFIISFNIFSSPDHRDNANMIDTEYCKRRFALCCLYSNVQDKINLFFHRLKHYTLRESKEWKSFLVVCQSMNTIENCVEFRVYCVHREGWHFYQAVSAAKIEFYAAIKRLREELGLVFVRAPQPVVLVQQEGPTHLRTQTTDDIGEGYSSGVTPTPGASPRNRVSTGSAGLFGMRGRSNAQHASGLSRHTSRGSSPEIKKER